MAALTTHREVEMKLKAGRPGKWRCGAGLYLSIAPGTTRRGAGSWVFRYMLDRKARAMGLGSVALLSLAEARDKAHEWRRRLHLDKVDPIEARTTDRAKAKLAAIRTVTFSDAARQYIRSHSAAWKSAKHGRQWQTSLATYAFPIIGELAVADIDTAAVSQVLSPIWTTKPETASRVRQRMESVLDWARVHGYRTGDNPAVWKGHLDKALAAPSKKRSHYAALPYAEIGQFMTGLRGRGTTAAKALEFLILTAVRTNEVIKATWDEIDLVNRVWVIPAARMKNGNEHRVPLSDAAVHLLENLPRLAGNPYLFPGIGKGSKPLGHNALFYFLREMGRGDITVHGFRSSFRDWASETTSYSRDVCEMALAHSVEDKVEAAYRRGDLFTKRAHLMQAWATYCGSVLTSATVTPIRAGIEP